MAEVTTANSWEMPPLCPKCRVPWAAGCSLADCPKRTPSLAGTAETMTALIDYLRGEAEAAEQNYRGSLGRAEELGVTAEGESYRRAAYRSDEAAADFRRWIEELTALRASLATAQEDTRRLDWLESQSNGDPWVARISTTGRGYRLANSHWTPNYASVREALDAARPHATPEGE